MSAAQTVEGVTPAPAVQQPWTAPVANPPQPFSNAPAPAQPTEPDKGKATSPQAVVPDVKTLQEQLAAEKARADELEQVRGWRADFTRANQAGLGQFVRDVLAGKPIADVKRDIEAMRANSEWLAKAGGREALQPFVDILNEPEAGTEGHPPAATPAIPGPTPDNLVRKEDLPKYFAQWKAAEQGESNARSVATSIATAVGLEASEPVIKVIRRQFDVFMESLVGVDEQGRWLREPTTEDLNQAASQTKAIYDQVRVKALTPNAPPPTPTPPVSIGREPGGSAPAKPVEQMTQEEVRQHAQGVIQQTLAPGVRGAQPKPLPQGMDWV